MSKHTFIHPVRDAIEDAANLSSVSDPVHGLQVGASGVVQVIVGHEGQGIIGWCPGGKQQWWLIILVSHPCWCQWYRLSVMLWDQGNILKVQ